MSPSGRVGTFPGGPARAAWCSGVWSLLSRTTIGQMASPKSGPASGGILRGCPLLGVAICPSVVSRVGVGPCPAGQRAPRGAAASGRCCRARSPVLCGRAATCKAGCDGKGCAPSRHRTRHGRWSVRDPALGGVQAEPTAAGSPPGKVPPPPWRQR